MRAPTDESPREIVLEGIGMSFGAKRVLRGIDLTIRRGELVAIVGGSGCGKSVTLDLITGLLAPSEGRVSVANHSLPGAPLQDLSTLSEDAFDQIRLHWSVVFQRNALYSGTVLENISLWLRQHTELSDTAIYDLARECLRDVGFTETEDLLTRRRSELSGGMAKRVAVARAIAMDPAIIFYDEPTSGLDPSLCAQLHGLILATHRRPSAAGSRTSLVITHDKDMLARLRPRIVMLHDGGVHFDGSYAEFTASTSDVIRPYFELMPALQSISIG